MAKYDDRIERIAELLRLLPPPPEAWVRAAQELPLVAEDLDRIFERAEADAEFRRTLIADLESALRAEGVEPRPEVVEVLRRRYSTA
jgi:hypothetical protein